MATEKAHAPPSRPLLDAFGTGFDDHVAGVVTLAGAVTAQPVTPQRGLGPDSRRDVKTLKVLIGDPGITDGDALAAEAFELAKRLLEDDRAAFGTLEDGTRVELFSPGKAVVVLAAVLRERRPC